MLTQQDIDSLPDDPAEAFAVLGDLFEAWVDAKQADREGIAPFEAVRCAEDVQAIVAALELEKSYPRLVGPIPRNDGQEFLGVVDGLSRCRSSLPYPCANESSQIADGSCTRPIA